MVQGGWLLVILVYNSLARPETNQGDETIDRRRSFKGCKNTK